MSAQNTNGTITLKAGEALAIYRRVKLDSSGDAVYADVGDSWVGVTQAAQATVGGAVAVRLRYDAGTFLVTVAEAVAAGAEVFTADHGKIVPTGGAGLVVGVTREAATADNDQIEVLFTAQATTPGAATVSTATLANAVADQIFGTTVVVANTGTPDGVGHVTGQVQDAQGNSLTGYFLIALWANKSAAYAAAADDGDLAAAANSLLVVEWTGDALTLVRTHSDGSWGADFNLTTDGTLHAMASVLGKVATANAAITGN